jgi:DNA-binding transcriptional regulator YiaG
MGESMDLETKEAKKFLSAMSLEDLLTITYNSKLSTGLKSYLNRVWLKKNRLSSKELEKARRKHPLYSEKKRTLDREGRLRRLSSDNYNKKNSNKAWSKEEIDTIKKNMDTSNLELAKMLGRSRDSIHSKKREIREFRVDKRDKRSYSRFNHKKVAKPWTNEEIQTLKKNAKLSDSELADMLGRSRGSISQKKK